MLRTALLGVTFAAGLTAAGGALAQGTPPLPSMPHPPSFDDAAPASAKSKKPTKKAGKRAAASSGSSSPTSFERPNKFVPAEFDHERSSSSGVRTAPMMSSSGRPGMGMRF